MANTEDGDAPVWNDKLPGLAQGICQELDRRLGQVDRGKPECIQGVDAAANETEADANHPHAQSEAWQSRVICAEANASGKEDFFCRRLGFLLLKKKPQLVSRRYPEKTI